MDSSDIRIALATVRAFILYRLVPTTDAQGRPKLDKVPTNPLTGYVTSPHDATGWMLPAEAQMWADQYGEGYGVGVVISEDVILPNGRRLFCLDIDKCRDGNAWAPHAISFIQKLEGGGVEVSVSGNGLHVFGTYAGPRPDHGTRNKTYGLELYTRLRFIAVTGLGAVGDPLKDLTRQLHKLCEDYFPPHDDAEYGDTLTTVPVPEWEGPDDDDELIRRMIRSGSPMQVFGGKARFADLWEANESVLAGVFPPQQHGVYDASAADLALANHLAFYTGNHGERMLRLMNRSKLIRPKWERPGYLHNTIQRACGSQRQWYKERRSQVATHGNVPTLETPVNAVTTPAVPAAALTIPPTDARPETAIDKAAGTSVPWSPAAPLPPGYRPPIGGYLLLNQQQALFAGCTYIQDIHEVLMPEGHTLNQEKFNTQFAGYEGFAITTDGTRPARKAWDAFIFSEIHSFPKVKGMFFDPRQPAKTLREQDGFTFINSYVPSHIIRKQGDVSPFLTHLNKLLPHGNDARILLAYFAACVQHAGEKFQWWPLIQGVEGNGKSTLSFLLEYAIGERYTHWPKSSELGSKFNGAFYGKLLICCEDVYVSEARGSMWETLKPMITSPRLEIESKGVDKVTRDVCFNGVMNSNHKNALRKTANDRRIGPFFCAQQKESDLIRDGMDTDYMKRLRAWRLGEGREIVADYLMRYEIPDEWNPARDCIRCPKTTATKEAIVASFGVAEQEVLEKIAQHALGFRGGWISSTALDNVLASIGKGQTLPRNKRREMLESLGYMPHPALPEGRSTVIDTDGTRPHLYCLPDAPGAQETVPSSVMLWYQAAQKL